jgi:hypothetical protein
MPAAHPDEPVRVIADAQGETMKVGVHRNVQRHKGLDVIDVEGGASL